MFFPFFPFFLPLLLFCHHLCAMYPRYTHNCCTLNILFSLSHKQQKRQKSGTLRVLVKQVGLSCGLLIDYSTQYFGTEVANRCGNM